MDQEDKKMNDQMLSALGKLTDALVDSSRMTGAGGSAGSTSTRAGAVGNKNKRLMDEQLRKNYEGLRNWGKSQDTINKMMPDLISTMRKRKRVNGKLEDVEGDYLHTLARYNEMLGKTASHLDDLGNEVDKLKGQGVFNQQRALVILTKKTNSFTSQLAQNQRSASLFNAALIESHTQISEGTFEYEQFMTDLGKAASNLDKSILKKAKIIDEETGQLRQDLSDADFSKLSQIMGQAQTTITESLAGLKGIGVNSFDELAAAHSKASAKKPMHSDASGKPLDNLTNEQKAGNALGETGKSLTAVNGALSKMALDLLVQGVDLGKGFDGIIVDGQLTADGLSKLNKAVASSADGGQVLIAKLKKLDDELDKSAALIAKEAEARNDAVKMLGKRFSDPVAGAKDKLVAALEGFSIGASLKNLGEKLGDAAKQVSAFNIAQVPATFWSVQKASIAMGMSFDETVKFMQENKRTMAIYGDSFSGLTGDMKGTFAKFGYTMQQGAEIVGPAIEAAITSGVNTKDGKALNNFIDQSMESFKHISGIVNITAAEYMKLNAELLNSQDVAGTMVGMDQQRAQAYAKDLVALRDNYVQMGLSTQQAQALMQAQQAQQREKVTSRVREAAKGMMLAQQVGMSPEESQRYFQLGMKGNKSVDEMKEYTDIGQRMGSAAEEKRVNSYDGSNSGGMGFDSVLEALMPGGPSGDIIKTGVQRKQAENAGTNVDDKTAYAAGQKATGNESVADMGNAANMASSVLNNVFTKAALAAATTLGMLALSSGNLTKILGSKSLGELGKSLFKDGLVGGTKNVLSTGKNIAGGLWTGAKSMLGFGSTAAEAAGGTAAAVSGASEVAGAAGSAAGAAGEAAGLMSKFGSIAKVGGKLLGTVGSVVDVFDGVSDLMDGKQQKEMPSGLDMLSPMRWGMYGGAKINQAVGQGTGGGWDNFTDYIGDKLTGNKISAWSQDGTPALPATPAVTTPAVTNPAAAPAGNATTGTDVNKQSSTPSPDSGILNVTDKDSKEQLLTIAKSMETMVALLQSISSDGLKATVDLPVGQSGTTSARRVPSAYEYQTGKKST